MKMEWILIFKEKIGPDLANIYGRVFRLVNVN